jgi:hypothetical protein
LSALETAVGYLAMAGTAVVWANVAAAAVNRVGVKPVLLSGMGALTLGLLFFTEISFDGSYWADLFPGFLVVGIALPFAAVPITIAALAGSEPHEAGLTAGLLNTSQQIGGAVGVALLATIAASTTDDRTAAGAPLAAALTDGFASAFRVAAAIAFVGVVVVAVLMRERELRPFGEPAAEVPA